VYAWIGESGIEPAGPIEQPHVRPWSTVLRVPTSAGNVWFKANHPELAHEARVVSLIARRRPDLVPQLLAADLERGWMLMADGGERLRDVTAREGHLGRWLSILPLYGELQLALMGDADVLAAAGALDRRLPRLPDAAASLALDDAQLAQVCDWCDRLATLGIPASIEHDDLHDGQVFVCSGRYLFFDWGDACVTHPFCTLSVTLEGSLRWGLDADADEPTVDTRPFLDAYLEPFERYGSRQELLEAARSAVRLGWVVRALFNAEKAAALGPNTDQERVLLRLRLAFSS
jgi:hypothetical protein